MVHTLLPGHTPAERREVFLSLSMLDVDGDGRIALEVVTTRLSMQDYTFPYFAKTPKLAVSPRPSLDTSGKGPTLSRFTQMNSRKTIASGTTESNSEGKSSMKLTAETPTSINTALTTYSKIPKPSFCGSGISKACPQAFPSRAESRSTHTARRKVERAIAYLGTILMGTRD